MELKHKEKEALWQTFFEQHAYLKETGGWHLSLERLLGEALTPVAFPPKESWQELTKDGLPLLQHEDLLPCVAAAAAGRLDGALSLVLGSQDIETPEEMHQSLTDLRAFAANQEAATALFTALLQQDDAAIRRLAAEHGLQERACASSAGPSSMRSCRLRQRTPPSGKRQVGRATTARSADASL